MNKGTFILPPTERPSWLESPHSFCRIVDQQLFPFAYGQDNDDIACWAKGMSEKVFIIHDFASLGFEDEGAFDDVWSWFRSAVDETVSWD